MSYIDNESNEFTKPFNEKTLYIDFFNEFIYCTAIGLDTNATKKNSPMYVFNLLNMRPDRTLKEFKEKFLFYNSTGYLETTKKDQYKRTVNIMMQFLNVSTYLYNYAIKMRLTEDKISWLLEILTVAAAAEFDSLYSSRRKNEFAYYFEMFLSIPSNQIIRIYNTDEYRQIYTKRAKKLRDKIDSELKTTPYGDNMVIYFLSNLYILYDKREDVRLPKLGIRYNINIGTFYITARGIEPDDATFNTNFK